jgi:hypothetical protein
MGMLTAMFLPRLFVGYLFLRRLYPAEEQPLLVRQFMPPHRAPGVEKPDVFGELGNDRIDVPVPGADRADFLFNVVMRVLFPGGALIAVLDGPALMKKPDVLIYTFFSVTS